MNSPRALIGALLILVSACEPPTKSPPGTGHEVVVDVAPELEAGDEELGDGVPEDNAPAGPVCDPVGLSLDGQLLLSADPLSTQPPLCESSWIHFGVGGGYDACCDEHCCEWNYVPIPVLPGEGEVCEPAVGCLFGLSCFGAAGEAPVCGFGAAGDPCDAAHLCAEGHFCGGAGLCLAQLTDEGAKCSGDADCAWPLSCVCPPGGLCRCYDGSLGDPCTSDTCDDETYCTAALLQDGVFLCHDGAAGDPCVGDWQCNDGYSCVAEVMGVTVCAAHLGAGAPCTDAVASLEQCGPGLACNSALAPQVCAPLGIDGAPCTETGDCAAEYICRPDLGACWDGRDGDPCVADTDCTPPYTCVGDVDGECTWILGDGEVCEDSGSAWIRCASDLVCNTTFAPDQCTVPGEAWDFCFVDGDCADALFCLPGVGVCYEGVDGDSCEDDSWCRDGWHCHGTLGTCTDGDFGDPCDEGICADGFTCHPAEDKCYDGSPGTPCDLDGDCAAGVCVWLWDGAYCVLLLEAGGPCGSSGLPFTTCGWGATCVEPEGECSGGLAGELCNEAFPCAEGHLCHGEPLACVPFGEGVECETDADCSEGLHCVPAAGACHDGDNGDPCKEPVDCAEGLDCLLDLGECSDGGPGAPCVDDAGCPMDQICDPADALCVGAE